MNFLALRVRMDDATVINFRTAIFNETSLVTDARVIATTYIRGWFLVDVIASFPFDLLLSTDSSSSKAGGGFRLARLLRLGRLVRVAAFGTYPYQQCWT